jgi:hypothetical protein
MCCTIIRNLQTLIINTVATQKNAEICSTFTESDETTDGENKPYQVSKTGKKSQIFE